MKLARIIGKNLKVLFRSKGSAVMTIFGPLLIIVLVGLAFNNSSSFEFSSGVYSTEYSKLTESFISNLENDNFNVKRFSSQEECVQKIREGAVHTCIIFPPNFRIENDRTNEIVIYVDNSRTNIVYQVVSSLNSNLDLKTNELSLGMTNTLTSVLTSTKDALNKDILTIINLKKADEQAADKVSSSISSLNNVDLSFSRVDLSGIESSSQNILSSAKELRDKGWEIADTAKDFAYEVEQNTSFSTADFESEIADLRKELSSLYNATPDKLNKIRDEIDDASRELDDLEGKLEKADSNLGGVADNLRALKLDLEGLGQDLDSLKSSLEDHVKNIEAVKVTNAQSIVSPVTTKVEPVTTQTSKMIFLFPNLLLLLIMFISLLLAGTIMIMEKSSRAYFRNFITPTRDEKLIIGNYLTSLIVVVLQVIVIIGLAYIFLRSPLFTNFHITFLIILLSVTIFTLVGMLIGSIFSTQEGVLMITISIGTVFLLLSNFILPLEDISGFLSQVARFNPFVVAAEAVKKSMLFGSGIDELAVPLVILAIYAIVLAGLILLTKSFVRNRYLQSLPHFLQKHKLEAPEDSYLKLGKGVVVKSKAELLEALKQMSETEFKSHCYASGNDFSIWIRGVLQDSNLARKLRNKSRTEMIEILRQK